MRKKQTTSKKEKTNLDFYKRTQPMGGLYFNTGADYIKNGAAYEQCLHVYDYPTDVDKHWLTNLTNISNTITTIDISTVDTNEVKNNINRSIQEQSVRRNSASNYADASDAATRQSELTLLYDEVSHMGDTVKYMDTRIFLSDLSLVDLEERKKKIVENLDSDEYKTTIFLNEGRREWLSMYQNYTQQQSNVFAMPGQPIQSSTLAAGHPFHFSFLEDPNGTFFGSTMSGGNFIWDIFHKSESRLYYNGLCVGEMGSGKSTFLKKIQEACIIRGFFVRVFDVSGEFRPLTLEFGGKIIKADGTESGHGTLNPWQIMKVGDNESVNYARHLSKMRVLYTYWDPGADSNDIKKFSLLCRKLYEKFNLVPVIDGAENQISGLHPDQYPISQDFLNLIDEEINTLTQSSEQLNELEKEIAKENIRSWSHIHDTIQDLIDNYGPIFNGYTTIDNIEDEQVVCFDISDLKEMAPNVFDSQMYSMLWLCWSNAVCNGSIMKDKWEKGEIAWEDIVRTLIICDESHRWLNINKLQAVDDVTVIMREARKYFAGVLLASQQIRDYVPEGSSDKDLNKIKNLFELTQYKFIFRQDENTIKMIDRIFGDSMTSSQKKDIPTLDQGECIYCCSGDSNMKIKIYLSDLEERLFAGGA